MCWHPMGLLRALGYQVHTPCVQHLWMVSEEQVVQQHPPYVINHATYGMNH